MFPYTHTTLNILNITSTHCPIPSFVLVASLHSPFKCYLAQMHTTSILFCDWHATICWKFSITNGGQFILIIHLFWCNFCAFQTSLAGCPSQPKCDQQSGIVAPHLSSWLLPKTTQASANWWLPPNVTLWTVCALWPVQPPWCNCPFRWWSTLPLDCNGWVWAIQGLCLCHRELIPQSTSSSATTSITTCALCSFHKTALTFITWVSGRLIHLLHHHFITGLIHQEVHHHQGVFVVVWKTFSFVFYSSCHNFVIIV